MLSILIPIYNFKVVKLVDALKSQCDKLKLDYEILCFDDGSSSKIKSANAILASYFKVNYTELSENLGRARIRNWLAKTASFDNLLFLDCDTKIIKKDFIDSYCKLINKHEVVSGGRIYSKKKPKSKSKVLHWLYGTKRESKKAKFRNKNAVNFFHSNNFLVKRNVIVKYPFNEKIKGYGYEDLLWAQHIYNKGIIIKHIDNPTEHLGLEKAKDFLAKTKKSIENLVELKRQNNSEILKTRLVHFDELLDNWRIKSVFIRYFSRKKQEIEKNLLSDKPKIFKLDLYKYLIYIENLESKA